MKLFTVSYETPPMRAIWTHIVLAEDEQTAKDVVKNFHIRDGVIIKKVYEHNMTYEGIIF